MSKDIKIGIMPCEVGDPIVRAKDMGALRNYYIDEIAPLWEYTTGIGVTVMVGDTGASTHVGGIVHEKSNSTNEPGEDDLHGHGANVQGIIMGQHNPILGGILGNAPSVRMLSDKTLESSGSGILEYVKETGRKAIRRSPDILNLSLDIPQIDKETNDILGQIRANGTEIFVAAGNAGSNDCGGIAESEHTIVIGALNEKGVPANFSDKCPQVTFYWYGTNIYSFNVGQRIAPMSGTSQATPGAVSIYSLLKSYARTHELNVDIVQLMKDTCDSLGNAPGMGYGKLNPMRALQVLVDMVEPVSEDVVEEDVEAIDGNIDMQDPSVTQEPHCPSASKGSAKINLEPWIVLIVTLSALIYAAFG